MYLTTVPKCCIVRRQTDPGPQLPAIPQCSPFPSLLQFIAFPHRSPPEQQRQRVANFTKASRKKLSLTSPLTETRIPSISSLGFSSVALGRPFPRMRSCSSRQPRAALDGMGCRESCSRADASSTSAWRLQPSPSPLRHLVAHQSARMESTMIEPRA
jgi:hypothetical protein